MFRLTKETDYGLALLVLMARGPVGEVHAAADLADRAKLPRPMVGKILKKLVRLELLVSHRGARGGYSLGRSPKDLSLAQVIGALEGGLSLTQCGAGEAQSGCVHEDGCPVCKNWHVINRAVAQALSGITLERMAQPLGPIAPMAVPEFAGAAAAGN